MTTFSFVVPIYNDGYLAEAFCQEFQRVFREFLNQENIQGEVELIFINDGSKDNSYQTLLETSYKYPFVKLIGLSRNFGQHIAISCGYRHASGEYIGMLDVDMQDPPNEIPRLINKLKEEDADIIIGVRPHRKGPLVNKLTSKAFHFVLNKLTGYETPTNIANLRIMTRRFINVYNALTEHSRFIPALEGWIGFKKVYIDIAHQERQQGISSYNLLKRIAMAVDTITSFSDLPLRIAINSGFLIALISFIGMLAVIVRKLIYINLFPGFTTTIALILFAMATQLISIGLVGLYIGKILREVQNRPLYIIANQHNFNGILEQNYCQATAAP